MSKLIKKTLALWLIIYLTIAPPLAYAASAGGWSFSAFDVATSVVTAMKNGGTAAVTVAKSPISAKIAKGIVGGVIAGAAIPLAISQLTGIALDAVQWVLDPANNAIKYKVEATSDANINSLCIAAIAKKYPSVSYTNYKYISTSNGVATYNCYGTDSNTGATTAFATLKVDTATTYKSIPISTVADKIYDNAKTDIASKSIVDSAVKDYVNEGSADSALDAAKADTDAEHACGSGTHWSGSACVATPTDLPALDFSSILSAIKSLGELLSAVLDKILTAIKDLVNAIVEPIVKVINDAWAWIKEKYDWWFEQWTAFKTKVFEFIDWFKSDPDLQKDNKPDIDDTQPTKSAQDFDSNYINFGGQCPSFSPTTISVGIVAVPISFNAQPLCDFAILCRPIILALAYFAAMAIVANAIRSE